MKKIISVLTLAMFLWSMPSNAQQQKPKEKSKKECSKDKKLCTAAEMKSCTKEKKAGCCAKK